MKNTETPRTARLFGRGGGECQVATDRTELPRGSFFTVAPGVPARTGALVLFSIGRRARVGRWLPNIGGHDWILQPGRLIACAGAPVRVIGPIIKHRTRPD